ncbi:MAG: TetR/AcrR family transcriptional regulator [Eggerthellaceae bacterium]|nr:TetR/AcrR family transcriptional regulator [Eggerthellaceae bacterium]
MKHENASRARSKNDVASRIIEVTASLAMSRSLEDVSVSDICENAGVSRTTFYYHFKDKFDIVQTHYDAVAENNLFMTGRTLTWRQAHYMNTSEVLRNKGLYQAAFELRGYQSLFSYAKRRRIETLEETIVDFKHARLDEELVFQIYALAEGEVACVGRWFKGDMSLSLDKLCDYLEGIVPKRLHDLLDKPVSPML